MSVDLQKDTLPRYFLHWLANNLNNQELFKNYEHKMYVAISNPESGLIRGRSDGDLIRNFVEFMLKNKLKQELFEMIYKAAGTKSEESDQQHEEDARFPDISEKLAVMIEQRGTVFDYFNTY